MFPRSTLQPPPRPSGCRPLLLCGALLTGLCLPAARPAAAQTAATVTVQAGTSLCTLPAPAFGVNTAAWDGLLLDSAVPALLQQAGLKTLRFPGGSVTDVYHWQTNTASQGQYLNAE